MANSEIVSKKRGRPRAFEDWELDHAEKFCDATTERGKQNWLYSQRAINELMFAEPIVAYKFLPSETDVMVNRVKLPMVLLTELGRLNSSDMRFVAKEIDARGLTERDATKFVKRLRKGNVKSKFNKLELINAIANSIDSYRETHDCTIEQAYGSVRDVLEIISGMLESSQ